MYMLSHKLCDVPCSLVTIHFEKKVTDKTKRSQELTTSTSMPRYTLLHRELYATRLGHHRFETFTTSSTPTCKP